MAVDKLVDSSQLDADLTSVANAIRTKGGTSASLAFPADFISAIGNIPSGGGGFSADEVATRDYSGAVQMTSEATSIVDNAFKGATGLTSIAGPGVLSIEANAFSGCRGLSSIDFPEVTRIGPASSSNSDIFAFRDCSSLERVFLPKLLTINGRYTLGNMGSASHHVTIVLPKLTAMGSSAFRNCVWAAIDLGPDLAELADASIMPGQNFKSILILRRSSGIVSALTSASINGLSNRTTVYIPKALYDHLGDGGSLDYKVATNWSAKASTVTWAQIEGSIYETQYADGTTIPTS